MVQVLLVVVSGVEMSFFFIALLELVLHVLRSFRGVSSFLPSSLLSFSSRLELVVGVCVFSSSSSSIRVLPPPLTCVGLKCVFTPTLSAFLILDPPVVLVIVNCDMKIISIFVDAVRVVKYLL